MFTVLIYAFYQFSSLAAMLILETVSCLMTVLRHILGVLVLVLWVGVLVLVLVLGG